MSFLSYTVFPKFWKLLFDYGESVVPDAAGNIFLAGHTDTLNGRTFNGVRVPGFGTSAKSAFLVRYSPSGEKVWTRMLGYLTTYNLSVALGNSGAVYVAGSTLRPLDGQPHAGPASPSNSSYTSDQYQFEDSFLMKYDLNGQRQ